MDLLTFSAVLAGALMHASWNAVIKVGLDRFSSILLLAFVQSVIAIVLLPFFAQPVAASWPWLVASAALHTGYKLFLIRAYGHGDLAQIYPIARGTAPLVVAILGLFFFGESLTPAKSAAVAAIGGGVILLAWQGRGVAGLSRTGLAYALGTAVFTASYTLVDGYGARLSETASGFTLWMFVLDGMGMATFAALARGRAGFVRLLPALGPGLAAGVLSLGSYWIAIWAFTRAPIAAVAALRESSVLFALLIAVLFVGEKVTALRAAAASLIVAGILLLRL